MLLALLPAERVRRRARATTSTPTRSATTSSSRASEATRRARRRPHPPRRADAGHSRAAGRGGPRAGGAAPAHGMGRRDPRDARADLRGGGRGPAGACPASRSSETSSPEETERAGAALAATLAPGDVVLVSGELGAGKTTFVRGAARALGVTEPVTSPTFVVGHLYEPGVAHLDLYRLAGARRRGPGAARSLLRAGADHVRRVARAARARGAAGRAAGWRGTSRSRTRAATGGCCRRDRPRTRYRDPFDRGGRSG